MNVTPYRPAPSTSPCTLMILVMATMVFLPFFSVHAGSYLDSAHGNSTYGVNRSSIASHGYERGNCAHCHEQHASITGLEPTPANGSPSPFALFANNFNKTVLFAPWASTDDFCFYCHINVGAVQSEGGITNDQYCNTFGGYNIVSASSIYEAFNLGSYHNLYDIQRFSETTFNFFTSESNPCVACHNPHLAKRNKAYPSNPAYAAISRPTDHGNLWGDDADERMDKYSYYRPPYYYGSTTTYEPGGAVLHNGSLTPDYNTFCLDCHQYQVPTNHSGSMNPDTPAGYLSAIDWSSSGDMHGERARVNDINGSPKDFGTVIAPYNETPVQSNYVLSCLDCHEPHGTVLIPAPGRASSYLLRKEVNNNKVDGCGPAEEKYFCEQNFCGSCHTFSHCGGPNGCFQCHYHGAVDKFCAGPWYGPNF